MIFEAILLLLTVLCYFAYRVHKKSRTYWQSMGVPVPPQTFLVGNHPSFFNWEALTRKTNITTIHRRQYDAVAGLGRPDLGFYGVYAFGSPSAVITDPDLAKRILVRDFDTFVDRVGESTAKLFAGGQTLTDKVWQYQLTVLTGEPWKNLRTTFSNIFTSGKMRHMTPLIKEVAARLDKSFEESEGREVDLIKHFGNYVMDTLCSCAFGVDAKSFEQNESIFVKMASESFRRDTMDMVRFGLFLLPGGPTIMKMFGIPGVRPVQAKFFHDVVSASLKQRRASKQRRNDVLDFMLDAIENPDADDDKEFILGEETQLRGGKKIKTYDELMVISTAVIMLMAGYDTTANTLSYACQQMALNPEIQDRLAEEIDAVVEKGEELTYEKIFQRGFPYMDAVIDETFRFTAFFPGLQRSATKDYRFEYRDPETKREKSFTVKKGEEIYINLAGMARNPKYYANPDKFDPEHFSQEAREARNKFVHLPFGQGPRICLGMRFALLEAKYALATILRKYRFVATEKTRRPIKLDPEANLGVVGSAGLWVKVEKRQN